MKSRGMYETPGGTILIAAHRGIESITLDRGAAHLKDELMPKYAELIYNGFWFTPEREMLQAAIDKSQEFVTGRVKLKLYKGNVAVVGRESPYSLYDQDLVTFEEGAVAYDHRDAAGFIRLNALRLRTLGQRRKKLKLDIGRARAGGYCEACCAAVASSGEPNANGCVACQRLRDIRVDVDVSECRSAALLCRAPLCHSPSAQADIRHPRQIENSANRRRAAAPSCSRRRIGKRTRLPARLLL